MLTNQQLVECLEEIATEHELVGNLSPNDEARRLHKRSARKVRKLAERVAFKSEQFRLEKTIALGSQRIARQKGLIARIEALGKNSQQARSLRATFEQTQSIFEQQRQHFIGLRTGRRHKADLTRMQ
jgi:hypothetical protein